MADTLKTVTIDAGEWRYVDKTGISHLLSAGITFTFCLSDVSASEVHWKISGPSTVLTTDGYKIYFRPQTDMNNRPRFIMPLSDSSQNTRQYSMRGEWPIQCPVTGIIQNWRFAEFRVNDVDAPTAIGATNKCVMEDQFGNTMQFPCSGSGITVS